MKYIDHSEDSLSHSIFRSWCPTRFKCPTGDSQVEPKPTLIYRNKVCSPNINQPAHIIIILQIYSFPRSILVPILKWPFTRRYICVIICSMKNTIILDVNDPLDYFKHIFRSKVRVTINQASEIYHV